MRILLCAATTFEIQPTIDFVETKGWQQHISLLITGVGMMATTYVLTKEVSSCKPDLMIQAGIAGSFDPQLSLGDMVTVRDEVIGDLGVMESGIFRTLFEMGFQDANEHPWTNAALCNSHQDLLKNSGVLQVKGVTINEISTATDRIAYYKNELGASVESMEGAAFHYVALQEGIPFLQLRSVSNYVGERDKTKWNLKGSIESLNKELQSFLNKTLDT